MTAPKLKNRHVLYRFLFPERVLYLPSLAKRTISPASLGTSCSSLDESNEQELEPLPAQLLSDQADAVSISAKPSTLDLSSLLSDFRTRLPKVEIKIEQANDSCMQSLQSLSLNFYHLFLTHGKSALSFVELTILFIEQMI